MSVLAEVEAAPNDKPETFPKIKKAGEGAAEVRNPYETGWWNLANADETTFADLKRQSEQKLAAAGGGTANKLLKEAKKFVGTPYKWGGTTPLGFDCSGFTQYVFKQFGINLPRVSFQQAKVGARVAVNKARPGDLIFWDNSSRNPGADHVAIYLGNGLVIHAPKPGDAVKISKLWGNPWAVAMNL